MRRFIIALLAALVLGCAPRAEATTLKPHAVVHADAVRIGDIFEDAGSVADVPFMRAPSHARRIVLDALSLEDLATGYGLTWRPATRLERVVIERPGRMIGSDEIAVAMRDALIREGASATAAIEFFGRKPELGVPLDSTGPLTIQNLAFDPTSGRFSATVVAGQATSHAAVTSRMPITGRAAPTRIAVVLRRAIQAGEIVRRDDVTLTRLREEQVQAPDAFADSAAVIGTAARRAMRAGETLRAADFRAPNLVTRNGTVTIVLRSGALALTAQGKAMDDGARGDTIRVVNSQTKRTLEAIVVAPDTVAVGALPRNVFAN
jgi:flagella basal body P-ring formation protein FlgA